MLKNDFFGFPKVKWLHLKGEVDKAFMSKFYQDLTYQKVLNGLIFGRVIKKSGRLYWDTGHTSVRVCVYSPLCHRNLQSRIPIPIPFAHR